MTRPTSAATWPTTIGPGRRGRAPARSAHRDDAALDGPVLVLIFGADRDRHPGVVAQVALLAPPGGGVEHDPIAVAHDPYGARLGEAVGGGGGDVGKVLSVEPRLQRVGEGHAARG